MIVLKELTENPMVVYMDIRNWGRNKAETNPVATEASILISGRTVYIKRTRYPIMAAFAKP